MKIYVAGASKELERCKHWIGKCRDAGYEITHDWTAAVEKYGSGGDGLSVEDRASCARADLRGVFDANVLWLLAPPRDLGTTGSWIELGYALRLVEGSTRLIFVSPDVTGRVIFALLPRVWSFDSDEDAFRALRILHEKKLREDLARERVRADDETADEQRLADHGKQ